MLSEPDPDPEPRTNPAGNERLTAAVGMLVLVPVLVEAATILLGVHTFMSVHVFVGLALIPAVLLKLASTGWRFARYYTRSPPYVALGPPQIVMRLLAPLFVAATVALFGSGVAMGLLHGHALQLARRVHGPSSVIWLLLLGLHVLVYLRRASRRAAEDALPARREPLRGTTARAYAVLAVAIAGLVLGGATVSAQHRWVDLRRGHHREGRARPARRVLLAAVSSPAPAPYAGLGTWLDIYASQAWVDPAREVAAMARDGVRTLYLQTGNYEQPVDLVRAQALGRFIDAAHAAGLRVVAWYLPSFADPAQDERRALAAIDFRSASGQRLDAFALDIEASLLRPVWLRTRRLLSLSARLRAAVGPRYALGAIIPSDIGLRRHPTYWPGFPYRPLAHLYTVFLPMAYSTNAGVRGSKATRAYLAADVAAIRTRTGDPHVPIHLIGGIAGSMGAKETAGFMRAVADCSPLGYSLYEFPITSRTAWRSLGKPAAADDRPACT